MELMGKYSLPGEILRGRSFVEGETRFEARGTYVSTQFIFAVV